MAITPADSNVTTTATTEGGTSDSADDCTPRSQGSETKATPETEITIVPRLHKPSHFCHETLPSADKQINLEIDGAWSARRTQAAICPQVHQETQP